MGIKCANFRPEIVVIPLTFHIMGKKKKFFLKIANYSLLAVIGERKKIENGRGTALP